MNRGRGNVDITEKVDGVVLGEKLFARSSSQQFASGSRGGGEKQGRAILQLSVGPILGAEVREERNGDIGRGRRSVVSRPKDELNQLRELSSRVAL